MDSNPKSSLRTLINQVTKEKLAWLDSQRKTLKALFEPILDKYNKPENKASPKFLTEIHEALKSCSVISMSDNAELVEKTKDLTVFLNWIKPEDPDAAVYFGSKHLVQHWIDTLVRYIKFQIERCEYSCLYADAMTQYMDGCSEEVDMGDTVGDQEGTNKEKTMKEFSERIFAAPTDFDNKKFQKFLNETLFYMEDPEQKELLLKTRRSVEDICKYTFQYEADTINVQEIKLCIDGLLAEDLLGAEKNVTLKELRENEDALTEVCTLLKNRAQNFKQWEWPEPIFVDFRRNMAGRYRAYMDEDLITALFLHWVGAKWCIWFKSIFEKIYKSKMWKRGTGTVGDLYYKPQSIEGYRREFHSKSFLSILPSKMEDLAASGGYDDDGRRPVNTGALTPIQIKQKLLHVISNEIHLNSVLRPDTPMTVGQTDMEWFGPSLVHEAVLSLMSFFGVTKPWLEFFQKFLESPLKVGSRSANVQIRKRGAPISHLLTTLFGESFLFIMDLYVNQSSGVSVYRIHDDFWFWNHDLEKVTKAWSAMQEYTKLAGLKLNEEKSASVVCKSNAEPGSIIYGPEPLPQMKVKWGFIVLHSDGVFRISQELLDPHIKEMRKCLQESETAMSWVHCHNRYIRFFIRNFAEPAITFEKQHVVQIMQALQNIYKEVHAEANGDPVEALKIKFAKLWENKDVMDSWVHWPVNRGGLGLFNPFLDLIPLHEAYRKYEERESAVRQGGGGSQFAEVLESDKKVWERMLEESKKRMKRRCQHDVIQHQVEENTVTDMEVSEGEDVSDEDMPRPKKGQKRDKFKKRIGFQTSCSRYRETRWNQWRVRYQKLLENLSKEEPEVGDGSNWDECMYSGQLTNKFGDTKFINTNLIPLSLISAMQAARVHKN